jgi:hypothetical protein
MSVESADRIMIGTPFLRADTSTALDLGPKGCGGIALARRRELLSRRVV